MPTTTASIGNSDATPDTTAAPEPTAPVEKVSQDEMLKNFQDRLQTILTENKQLSDKIKENEIVALNLQGAIEALTYYNPPSEETVDNLTTEE